ncbi:MAG TPA: hypothetical protein P5555_10520 [Candidatus Paceibacterota bacterium]|nr:hypothetical protein [Verrucomicrobiota bacterium]HRZ45613.1 hypothetical protein [Candidatus Paceibacterota bacterium]HRZ92527.1 hypothetical protein [Candidatus Paceibacterota bacterium]
MKRASFLTGSGLLSWLALAALAVPLWGQAPRGAGPYGEWLVKAEFNGRAMESILSFSRSEQGDLTGQWISFWGITDLEDVRFENGQLTFTQVFRIPNGETMKSQFKGAIANRQLSGTVSSDRGEYAFAGERRPRMSRAVGDWDMTVKMGEREVKGKLVIRPGADNTLTGQWQSQRGESQITDVVLEQNTLRFKRATKIQDREWTSTFEGTLQRDALTGVFKSERGESPAEGKRLGAALIGDWILDLTTDRGTRKQRLRVNPDLTGLYGAAPVEKIQFEGDQVAFNLAQQFGDRTFEMKFAGKLVESKIEGELTSERGATKVTGAKIVRAMRGGGSR